MEILEEAKKEVEEMKKEFEEKSFALDLLKQFKEVNKRQFWIIIILIIFLGVSNFWWAYTFTQYDFVSYEQSTEGGGNANFIGNDGEIYNGSSENKDQNQKE